MFSIFSFFHFRCLFFSFSFWVNFLICFLLFISIDYLTTYQLYISFCFFQCSFFHLSHFPISFFMLFISLPPFVLFLFLFVFLLPVGSAPLRAPKIDFPQQKNKNQTSCWSSVSPSSIIFEDFLTFGKNGSSLNEKHISCFFMLFVFFVCLFPHSAISPAIPTSCSTHIEACNASRATDGITL